MRICIHRATNRILEMQSAATAGTLIGNAVNAGYAETDLDEREVDEAGYAAAIAEDPVAVAEVQAQEALRLEQEAKAQAILDNLPSWTAVEAAITNATTLAACKVVLLKLARVVYWLAKNRAD